ncbi:MAG: sensor signal transduction histidine kinase [Spirosoma sp.]|nr:sensor signal transduction histidine kinase [Spirosoma sp.]
MTGDNNPSKEDTASPGDRFQIMPNETRDSFWEWNLLTNQIWRSERFCSLFDYHPNELESTVEFWYNTIHPDDQQTVIEHLQDAVASGNEWADEYRLRRQNGSYDRVYDRGYPIIDNGKVVRMAGYMIDVSERTPPQQSQLKNNEDWQIALDSAALGTWLFDAKTSLVRWNDRCRTYFGYSTGEQIAGTELAKLVHPADQDLLNKAIKQVLQPLDNGRFDGEYRVTGAEDGQQRWLRCRGKAAFNEDGTLLRLAGTVEDITGEWGQEEVVRNVKKHGPAAFDNASVGIVITDIAGRFVQINKAFYQLIGYHPSDLEKNTYVQILHPDDLLRYQSQRQELLTNGLRSLITQVRCIRKDGEVVWISLHTTVIYDEHDQPESLFSIIQDITPDKALRDEQQKMLALVSNSLNFKAIADLDGRLLYINKAGRELVGLTEADVKAGRTVADFYPPEQYSQIRDVVIPTLLSRGSWSGRVSLKHAKTGEIIPCYANGIRIDDPYTGKPIGRGFAMRDLRTELAAQEAQRKLLALVENCVELMSVLELDGTNSYLNRAGMELLGFDNEQHVRDVPISQLHAPEHFVQVEQEVLPSVMNTGRWSGEMLVRHLKTGEIFPVFNNTIRIDDPHSGQPIAVGAVMRDMRPELAAKQALIASEARFRNMIMQAPVAIGVLRGEKLVIESANESILRLWGKGPEIIGKPLLAALPEIEGQSFVDLLNGVYQSGVSYNGYDVPARLNRCGRLETCYFNFVYAPIRENDGAVEGIMMVATEVTQQVQAKKELEQSEKRFRNLIRDAPMATAVYTGPGMHIELANDAMLRLWGKEASVIGKTLRDALPELEGQPFHQLLADVYTTGVAYHGTEDKTELVVDGKLQTFYFNFTYEPLRDAAGQVYAILNMAVDITYQVKAKQQLKETQESLREAINLAELAPWTNNLVTGEMAYSERVNDWLGVTDVITPEIISRCMHEKDRQYVERAVQAASQSESGGRMDLEYTVINQQTKQERIMRTQARVLFNEHGIPYLIRGTSQDITAQRMTEQALEQQVELRTEELRKINLQLKRSNQELERYAYVASHDLQEPLRKIQLYSGLLSEWHAQSLNAESRNYLSKIERSAVRMSVLIKNILDFSRISHESQAVEPVNLNEIVGAVLNDLELLLNQKKGRVDCHDLGHIVGIPLQINQLFYNLIANSLKFSREGVPPVITISSRELTDQELKRYEKIDPRLPHCEITVSDNGIGFNPAFGEKIFGLFQRLHSQQQYEGTGIGLSLCQRIVFNHQGDIWAEGEVGKGAQFHIILPTSL